MFLHIFREAGNSQSKQQWRKIQFECCRRGWNPWTLVTSMDSFLGVGRGESDFSVWPSISHTSSGKSYLFACALLQMIPRTPLHSPSGLLLDPLPLLLHFSTPTLDQSCHLDKTEWDASVMTHKPFRCTSLTAEYRYAVEVRTFSSQVCDEKICWVATWIS